MKIGIDARLYQEGLGIGRYVEKLLTNLEHEIGEGDEVVVFLRKKQWSTYIPKNSQFRKVLADIPWYSWREQLQLPFILDREHCDLVHFPHFNVPLLYGGRFVVTIHDLILLKIPESATSAATTRSRLTHWIKKRAHRIVLHSAVRRAASVIAVSQYVAQDIHTLLGVPMDKISVTYEAAESLGVDTLAPHALPGGVTEPYMLYVGNAYPHKNLSALLRVWKRVPQPLRLVLCGQEDFFYRSILDEIQKCGAGSRVTHLGFVSDDTLENLYQHARAYIFPSLEEGFGLPGLEALQYSLPVLASNSSVLPEILGDAALYFDPRSDDDILEKIIEFETKSELRPLLQSRALAQCKKYSWRQMARETHVIYRRLCQHSE